MKKILILVGAVALLTMTSCGKHGNMSNGTTSDTTLVDSDSVGIDSLTMDSLSR